ncbi:unnamed protein product [Caenorhabditis nigoni]
MCSRELKRRLNKSSSQSDMMEKESSKFKPRRPMLRSDFVAIREKLEQRFEASKIKYYKKSTNPDIIF